MDTNLFSKPCNNEPREYSITQLKKMANKIGLITTRQDYNQLCDGLRNYFFKNGIQTEEQLHRHIPNGLTFIYEASTRKLGENIDLDILLNSGLDDFLRHVEYFQNLENYSSKIEKIGENSVNAFVLRLEYTISSQTYSVVLKGSQSDDSDNLVYEYLVGQCINHYSRFYPCFAKTYSVGVFTDLPSYLQFSNISNETTVKNPFNTYIRQLNIPNISNMVSDGCKHNQHLVIFTQYMPIKLSLKQFLINISIQISDTLFERYIIKNENIHKLYELTSILHMLYQLLSSFSNMFTHYDLHLKNLILVEVPDNKFINVLYHYPDGKVLGYNMSYIPIIIDYGRSFINCNQMVGSMVNSKEIMKTVCSKDVKRSPSNPTCIDTCGNKTGFNYSTDYDEKKDTFQPSGIENIFIDYTRKNISHDCRLLHEILVYFKFNELSNDSFIIKKLVEGIFNKLNKMDNRYGTHEIELATPSLFGKFFKKEPTIDNVIMAANKLTEIISDPKFNINNDNLLINKTLYGTLHIWTDLSRPFEFR